MLTLSRNITPALWLISGALAVAFQFATDQNEGPIYFAGTFVGIAISLLFRLGFFRKGE